MDTKQKVELYYCEKCEQEVDETKFTMDKNGEVCDYCIESYGDLQYENWREREQESDMSGATEGDR